MKNYLALLIIGFLTHLSATAQNKSLYDTFNKGSFHVGIKIIDATDYSRNFKEKQGRNLKVIIWYPSKTEDGKSLIFQGYLKESKTDSSSWAAYFLQLAQNTDNISLMNSSIFGSRNLSLIKNRSIPLIIYSPGSYGDEFENNILCELLASQGYIVAAHQSLGPSTPYTKINPVGLESQARDIEFLIQKISNIFPSADLNKVGLIGWSWGGLASILVQMRNQNIDAVVSLDGSISLHEDKLKSTSYYNLQNINVPYLFASAQKTSEELNVFLSQLKYSESLYVKHPYLEHDDFNSLVFQAYFFTSKPSDKMINVMNSYRFLTSTVIEFLNTSFDKKNDKLSKVLKFQKEEGHIEYRNIEALPTPLRTDDFFELFKTTDKEELQNIFDNIYQKDSSYILFEPEEAIEFAYTLHYDFDNKQKAIQLLKMNATLYPNHYRTYGHLGSLCSKSKELPEALENFSKAYGMVVSKERLSSADKQDMRWYTRSIERLRRKLNEN